MLIAQISDPHITEPGTLIAGRVDTAHHLARAVAQLSAHDPLPDALLLTGDLVDRGSVTEYAHLRALLAPLTVPIFAIPGNHDRREPMRDAFADAAWMPQTRGSPICYGVDLGRWRLLALDTLVEGEDGGALGDDQLAWLERELCASHGRPVIVLMHHPPVDSGVAVMDAMKLAQPERFGNVIARHPGVERILCGHLHRTMHLRWRGSTVCACPSTADQLVLDFRRAAPLASVSEPPAFQLHWSDETDTLVTHVVPVGPYPGPFLCA